MRIFISVLSNTHKCTKKLQFTAFEYLSMDNNEIIQQYKDIESDSNEIKGVHFCLLILVP